MKNIYIYFFALLSWSSISQNDESYVDGLVTTYIQELVSRGVEKAVVYKSYCEGETQMITIKGKLCVSKGTFYESYVVWNEAGSDNIKKFDNCGSFYSVNRADTALSSFYIKEWAALLDDEVKPYRSVKYTGEPELRKTPQPCGRQLYFHSDTKVRHKKFNLFAISNNSEGENLNYTFNRTLKLVGLHELIEKTISEITFIREL